MIAASATVKPAGLRPPLVDLFVLGTLGALGIWGFGDAFAELRPVLGGLAGLMLGTVVGAVAASLRWGILTTAAVGLGAYVLAGPASVLSDRAPGGFIPAPDVVVDLLRGAVLGWADLLTLTAPVDAPDHVAAVPYVTGWVAGITSATIAGRLLADPRRLPTAVAALLALLGPLAAFLASTLTGTADPVLPVFRGLAFGLVAILWLAWRIPERGSRGAAPAWRGGGLGVVAVVVVSAMVSGGVAAVATAAAHDRLVVRERVQRPFEPREYASPLAAFRAFVKDGSDRVVLELSGAEPGDLVRLAVMDSYDGRLWNVGDPTAADTDSGVFELVSGRELVLAAPAVLGPSSDVMITIADYAGVWVPTVGYPSAVSFDEDAPSSTDLRYNSETGSLAVTTGIGTGTGYHLDTRRLVVDRDALVGVPVAEVALPPLTDVPDIISSRAIEFAGEAESPIDRLAALELALSTTGYLSHGLASDPVPSSAGHGADRMIALLGRTRMVGDAEQYASAFALMARSLGYPARVVVGFAPTVPEGHAVVPVTADQVTAWVEVPFRDAGWVPFFPTATNTDVPREEAPKPKTQPQPQVRQPPRQTDGRDEVVAAVQPEEPDPTCEPAWLCDLIDSTVRVIVTLGVLGVLYAIPVVVIGRVKARRRDRRLDDPLIDRRAAGAWDEVVDSYAELGYRIPRNALRVEIAASLRTQISSQLVARRRERGDALERGARRAIRADAARTRAERPTSAEVWRSLLETMRDIRTWRPGVALDGPLPDAPELSGLAGRTDDAVFRGGPIPPDEIDALWSVGDAATRDAAVTVSWLRRRLAAFRFHTRRDPLGTATARLEIALARARGIRPSIGAPR
ncbi:transglutaminase family protein [Pseudolysinimonas sp.]|jgi:transglutaminase-like putative cysteine protease|uniref:transglutaminase family protein n=1 Tax=Pseudolysinimonas sp. TaxID=2680009 RepID=UPI003783F05F